MEGSCRVASPLGAAYWSVFHLGAHILVCFSDGGISASTPGLVAIKDAHDIETRLNEVEKLLKAIISMPRKVGAQRGCWWAGGLAGALLEAWGAGRGQGQGESASLGSGSAGVFSLGKKRKQGAHSLLEREATCVKCRHRPGTRSPSRLPQGPEPPQPLAHRLRPTGGTCVGRNVCKKERVSSQYSRSEVVLTFFERSPLDQVLKNDNVHKIQPSFQSPVKISGETAGEARGGCGDSAAVGG